MGFMQGKFARCVDVCICMKQKEYLSKSLTIVLFRDQVHKRIDRYNVLAV